MKKHVVQKVKRTFLSLRGVDPMRFVSVSKWIREEREVTVHGLHVFPLYNKGSNPAAYDWEAFRSFNLLRRYWKRKMAEKVCSMAGNPPRDVLDCGCGSSPIITRFPTAIGIDIDSDKLDFMRTKVDNKLLCMDINNLEFPNESFDLVVCVETIEHLDTINTAMNEI
ncbi:class I SAM-dependent methyltransferase, partial [Dehalococcoidia bacterium]|nr:class I SAM-dependent methyltransferase [Dehalococcoidia bacterium]